MEEQAPGKGLLKVTGILYIILAALAIVGGILMAAGGGVGMMAGTQGLDGVVVAGGAILIGLGVYTIIANIFGLIMGILGVKNCDKPEKATVCMVLGIIVLVLGVIGGIVSIVNQGLSFSSVLSLLCSLVIPGLYTWGAYKNKQAA